MKNLQRKIPVPKYKQIIREIIDKINSNNMSQGDKLPSIEVLMKEYSVGKNTVLRALNELESAAFIYQVPGSGNYVRKTKRAGYINITDASGLRNTLQNFDLNSTMLDLKVIKPTKEVMTNLNIDEEEEVYYVKRLRAIEGRNLSIEESYYLKSVVPYLNQEIVEDSIFNYLFDHLNVKAGFTDHFLRIKKLNKENADLLNLQPGDPSILLESVYSLENGTAFDYSKTLYHYEESQFFIQGQNSIEL